jgi:predicted AAA+ superfamily ATPase
MIGKEQIKQILVDQRAAILNKHFGIERNILAEIKEKIKLPHVIVLTGLRRVGKSTLLRQIIKEYYADTNFYYINFEDERLFNFKADNFNVLYETLVELFGENKIFFIDEIQNIDHFENFVRRFYDAGFKFIITGSNANLLSKELGTKLTGRYIDLIVNPFSFDEYLNIDREFNYTKEMLYKTEERAKLKRLFGKYLISGGMPEFLIYKDPEILSRIYEDIVIKDIAVRYKVENLYEMRELYQYLITNFANRFSFNGLKQIVGLGSITTIKNYILFLTETFFISLVNKFDFSLKKQIVNEKKVYVADNGFIPVLSVNLNKDRGWLLENFVFNILKKRNRIFYFSGKNECDFVIQNDKKITNVIQVTNELSDNNKQRELQGLLEAMEYFNLKNGLILTSDQETNISLDKKNILVKPVWKWILEG